MFDDLIKKYEQYKYQIGSGSDAWVDIKSDYEIQNDQLIGSVMQDHYKEIGKEKIISYKEQLENFKKRVQQYNPENEQEEKEKNILDDKISVGTEIYGKLIELVS